jgi:peptidylamidoglycolate lyase
LFIRAHKVTISPYDPDEHVRIVDDYGQQIFKFTHDGKQLLMTLGEPEVTGTDEKYFGRPTDIAFLPDGSFFVSDGYVNTRVMKFDRDGKFLMQWGTKGTGPGQFNLVHCVAVNARGRVYVVDRSNSRIQVFDQNGVYLDEWPGIRSPTHIHITQDQHAWVSDSVNMRLMKYDLNGGLVTYFGVAGNDAGALNNPHHFSVDPEGNLYMADYGHYTVRKFVPKPGADRERIIGPRFVARNER